MLFTGFKVVSQGFNNTTVRTLKWEGPTVRRLQCYACIGYIACSLRGICYKLLCCCLPRCLQTWPKTMCSETPVNYAIFTALPMPAYERMESLRLCLGDQQTCIPESAGAAAEWHAPAQASLLGYLPSKGFKMVLTVAVSIIASGSARRKVR